MATSGLKSTGALSLPGLKQRLEGARSPAFKARLAQVLGQEAKHQTQEGFRNERDPYGVPWAPLKYRVGRILQDTGRMRASVSVEQRQGGFRLDIPVAYAPVHQMGSRPRSSKGGRQRGRDGRVLRRGSASSSRGGGIPRRQMIPMESTGGLGKIWSEAFDATATRTLDRYLRGGR